MTGPLATTARVAVLLGLSRRQVQHLCRTRGLGRKVGRDWLLTAAEVEALRERPPRGPRKGSTRRVA